MAKTFARHNRSLVIDGLKDTRVVFLMGARQVGKSTLAEEIAGEAQARIVSLDHQAQREVALDDPVGFIAELETPVVIDEVQRGGPDLLLAIKAEVDRDKTPGRFLLTGSANVLASRKVKDALTGRVDIVYLWPLAQSEIAGSEDNFVDALFAGRPPRIEGAPQGRGAVADRLVAGGYPEARGRPAGKRRDRWFDIYLSTTLDRDLQDVADAYKLEHLPGLLGALADRAANLLVYRDLSKRFKLEHKTVRSYVGLLELIFLVKRLPAWRPSIGSREYATPKVYLVDTGLMLHLLGADRERLARDDQIIGKALENFVAMEVMKHLDWAETSGRLYHYRQRDDEIDLVIESRSGSIACVETKAAASLRARDWRQLGKIRDSRPDDFKAGFLLYLGDQTVPLGDRLWAVPVSALWTPSSG